MKVETLRKLTLGALAVVPLVAAGVASATPTKPTQFSDIATDPFRTEIIELAGQGVIHGWADGTFRPLEKIERQAMIAFIYRMAGEPRFEVPESGCFNDVPADHQFAKEICWAKSIYVTRGWDDGSFRGSEPITREATAAFLRRVATNFGVNTWPETEVNFADVKQSDQFGPDIAWLSKRGITTGWQVEMKHYFRPQQNIDRNAMAAMLSRFQKVAEADTNGNPDERHFINNVPTFDPENIISDEVFFNGNSLTEQQIRDFINKKGARCIGDSDADNPTQCLKDWRGIIQPHPADQYCEGDIEGSDEADAATLLHRVGVACGVSPKVLMVILQKEQSLMTQPRTAHTFRRAMGFGCPDYVDGKCDPEFDNFNSQIYRAARQFQLYRKSPDRLQHYTVP